MSGPGDPNVPDESILAATRALEVIRLILEAPDLRGEYRDDPEATFNKARGRSSDVEVQSVGYGDIPEATRRVLASMGPEELAQLGRFGAALIEDGMYFEVPGVGRCYIK